MSIFRKKKYHYSRRRKSFLKKNFSRVPRRAKKSSYSVNLKLYQILLLIFIAGGVYFFFFYNFFQIKRLVFIDQKIVQESRMDEAVNPILDQRRYFVFPGTNIFLVNNSSIEGALLEQVPELDSLEIIKKYPDILKLKVKEVEPKAIWASKGEQYIIDGDGVVRGNIKDIENFDSSNLIRIVDQNNKDVMLRENVIYAKHLNYMKVLHEIVPELSINIEEIILPSALAEEIHMKTEEGWRVFFILNKDAGQQVENMKLILEKEIDGKIRREDLDYIDLRVENWAYYKKKGPEPKKEEEKPAEEVSEVDENSLEENIEN